MSVLPKVTRAFALLAEAEHLLNEALQGDARECGDPEEHDIRTTRDKVWDARREAQMMFRGDA